MAVKARTIKAKNVADLQIVGADAETAARLVGQQTRGDVIADEIAADNVAGVQVLDPTTIDTVDRLRTELASLSEEVKNALAGTETKAADDAQAILESAARELERPQPSRDLVVPKLEQAATILDKGSRMTDAADKLGKSMAKLALTAKALWHAATAIFGV